MSRWLRISSSPLMSRRAVVLVSGNPLFASSSSSSSSSSLLLLNNKRTFYNTVDKLSRLYNNNSHTVSSIHIRSFHISSSKYNQQQGRKDNKEHKDKDKDKDNGNRDYKSIGDYLKSKEFAKTIYLTTGFDLLFTL